MNTSKIIIIIGYLFCIGFSQVNTEAMREDSDKKLTNSFTFNYNLEQSDLKVEELGADYRLSYDPHSKFKSFIVLNYESEIAEETKDNALTFSKGFIHARMTKYLFKKLYGELFIQNEFNDFLYIDKRILVGSVARFKFDNILSNPIFIGIGIMDENEDYTVLLEPSKHLIRSTNYIKTTFNVMENITWDNTGYFQFAISENDDYRILFDSSLECMINKFIFLSVVLNYRYDSMPHGDLGTSYYQIENGITINF